MILRRLCIVYLVMMTMGCSSMTVAEFEGGTPELKLEEFFLGRTEASGFFEDRFGRIRKQFVVSIHGDWDGRVLTLEEDFRYLDGTTEKRLWKIRTVGEYGYEGTAENVVGIAAGKRAGNAFNWRYSFAMAVGNDVWRVKFDDWMFLMPNGVLINKATVTRWGFEIGRVTLAFRRLDEDADPSRPTSSRNPPDPGP
ncbi:MAG: DUF3833 domain-containing protein [Alphaproteobacteria bacterium]|nr:MAG: DUF3833 domain-containing protein [Alphaproteobacteria bacterium]